MQNVRDNLLKNHLKKFKLLQTSDDVFPMLRGVDGGITITYFDDNFTDTPIYTVNNTERERSYDVSHKIFLNNFEEEIYTKVFSGIDTNKNMLSRVLGTVGGLGGSEFGYDKWTHLQYVQPTNENMIEPVMVYTNDSLKRKTGKYVFGYIEKSRLGTYPPQLFDSRKVMISKIGGALNPNGITGVYNKWPVIVGKYITTQNHFFIIPDKDTDRDLALIKSLFMTKTARYLMTLTQKDLCVRGFENIPDYIELAKLLSDDQLFSDQWFYNTFNFSQALINEIESKICVITEKDIEWIAKEK